MAIIDSQVPAYEANTPKRPWLSTPNWPPSAKGDETVAAMDKLGIDGAIFISAFSLYGYDASYAVEVQRKHPGRFALVMPVDADDPSGTRLRASSTPGASSAACGAPTGRAPSRSSTTSRRSSRFSRPSA